MMKFENSKGNYVLKVMNTPLRNCLVLLSNNLSVEHAQAGIMLEGKFPGSLLLIKQLIIFIKCLLAAMSH